MRVLVREGVQGWNTIIGGYHCRFIIISFLWNNKIYEMKYYLWVLSLKRVEKYQRQTGLLSRLVSVTTDRGTVMKRTHLKTFYCT